jgi:hypothetical protein
MYLIHEPPLQLRNVSDDDHTESKHVVEATFINGKFEHPNLSNHEFCHLIQVGFSLCLFFSVKDGGDVFLQHVDYSIQLNSIYFTFCKSIVHIRYRSCQ